MALAKAELILGLTKKFTPKEAAFSICATETKVPTPMSIQSPKVLFASAMASKETAVLRVISMH
jgi:hypothetical protein